MNINEKLKLINLKIDKYRIDLNEFNRILKEEKFNLSEGDEEVILRTVDDIINKISALENEIESLNNLQ